jgi:hypothetical protein
VRWKLRAKSISAAEPSTSTPNATDARINGRAGSYRNVYQAVTADSAGISDRLIKSFSSRDVWVQAFVGM